MASVVKPVSKRVPDEFVVAGDNKRLKFQEDHPEISSYNSPPPSTISESRGRSLSPNQNFQIDKESNSNVKEQTRSIQDDVHYISLCSALSVLRNQREMIQSDIRKLNELKKRAIRDPESFITQLGTKNGDIVDEIPKKVQIISGDLSKLFK